MTDTTDTPIRDHDGGRSSTAPALKKIGDLIRKLDKIEVVTLTKPGGNS